MDLGLAQAGDRRFRKFADAENRATTAQLPPENRWDVHPVIDGCTGSDGDGQHPIIH
jgi:hypothetical protein